MPGEPAGAGTRSERVIAATYASRTCGMSSPPTSAEFHALVASRALHARAPTERERRIARVWIGESDTVALFRA